VSEIWLYVRATIPMGDMTRGDEAWINAADPRFEPLLEARYLKPVDPPEGELPPDEWPDDERDAWGLPPAGDPPPDGMQS
jgi:hypothetical protein